MKVTEDFKLWLFDLAHGNLAEKDVVSGFVKYYVLEDRHLSSVRQDIVFHTMYGVEGVEAAERSLKEALGNIAN